ncbi:MAG: kinase [Wenzhouxiangellaceae bacterium]
MAAAESCAMRGGILALSGPPGSGKTQMAFNLAQALRRPDRRIEVLGLDDFYIPEHGRCRDPMANHELFRTRGVPGTHQLERLIACMDSMRQGERTMVPRFDKLRDRPLPARQWRPGRPVQLFILEGWCLGATPFSEAELAEPVNDLEAKQDPDGTWRQQVNAKLLYYSRRLWPMFTDLWYFRPPDWETVIDWRYEQEQALPGEGPRKNKEEIEQFLQHFERIALAMYKNPPAGSLIVDLNDAHDVQDIRRQESTADTGSG